MPSIQPWRRRDAIRTAFPGLLSAKALLNRLQTEQWNESGFQFPICQNISQDLLQQEEEPAIILFISHQWDATHHPDPTGRQKRSLQAFLEAIAEEAQLWYLLFCRPKEEYLAFEQRREADTILKEGHSQAHLVLSKIQDWLMDHKDFVPSDLEAMAPDQVLSKIAIFYDYMCLPQNSEHLGIFRNESEEKSFRRSLLHLNELCEASLICCLRYDNDRFDQKAWCALERIIGDESFGAFDIRCDHLDGPRWILEQMFLEDDTSEELEATLEAHGIGHIYEKTEDDICDALETMSSSQDIEELQLALSSFALSMHTLDKLVPYTRNIKFFGSQADQDLLAKQVSNLGLGTLDPSDLLNDSAGLHVLHGLTGHLFHAWITTVEELAVSEILTMHSVLIQAAGLNCTSGADLALVALCFQSSQDLPMRPFYTECLAAWVGCKHYRNRFVVVLQPSTFQPDKPEWQQVWKNMRGDRSMCAKYLGGKLTAPPGFFAELCSSLCYSIPVPGGDERFTQPKALL